LKIVIYGCGQVGIKVAENLVQQKHGVTMIDRDADTFRKLEGSGCELVVGDAIDQDTLRKAGTESADMFLALTGEDNPNLFAAQVAKEIFKVKRVIVRVADPLRAKAFAELGLTTICATDLIADAVRKKLGGK
jgi:trk system potassium uptake protein TrkA